MDDARLQQMANDLRMFLASYLPPEAVSQIDDRLTQLMDRAQSGRYQLVPACDLDAAELCHFLTEVVEREVTRIHFASLSEDLVRQPTWMEEKDFKRIMIVACSVEITRRSAEQQQIVLGNILNNTLTASVDSYLRLDRVLAPHSKIDRRVFKGLKAAAQDSLAFHVGNFVNALEPCMQHLPPMGRNVIHDVLLLYCGSALTQRAHEFNHWGRFLGALLAYIPLGEKTGEPGAWIVCCA
ncbi:MAG: hypothetical protein WEA04_02180 [Candidatus Andersenbacteria bacterium]